MSARRLSWVAWALCVASALGAAVLLALDAGHGTPAAHAGYAGLGGAVILLAGLAFATTGALVATRMPRNPIGWLLLANGVCLSVGNAATQYADHVLFVAPGSAGGAVAAWLSDVLEPPCFGLLALVLLLFPDGRLPGRRWRWLLRAAVVGTLMLAVGYAGRSGPLDSPFDSVRNPVGLPGVHDLMDLLTGLGWLFTATAAGLSAVAMVRRLRSARGVELQQLKWIALGAAFTGLILVADMVSFFADVQGVDEVRFVLLALGLLAFPLAAGAAILWRGLYDIDVVINRAVVYGALTATLAATYAGTVLLLQLALSGITSGSDFAVAVSTLAAAAVFRPARARIQAGVDRRFYRARYDARRTLEGFAARLRDEVDLDALSVELRDVVGATMRPAHVSLWLREADR